MVAGSHVQNFSHRLQQLIKRIRLEQDGLDFQSRMPGQLLLRQGSRRHDNRQFHAGIVKLL
jgi:hypothetical protein